jgi:hypothetical protein
VRYFGLIGALAALTGILPGSARAASFGQRTAIRSFRWVLLHPGEFHQRERRIQPEWRQRVAQLQLHGSLRGGG